MEAHDLEIVIGKDGKVRIKTSGAKGKSCLQYIKLVEQIVGKAESKEMTSEFYEPDSHLQIDNAQQQRQQQRRQE